VVDTVGTLITNIPPPENLGITDFLYFLTKEKRCYPQILRISGETGGYGPSISILTNTIPLPSDGDTPQ
jgi:hypothetical protein